MSLACRFNRPIQPASKSSSCARIVPNVRRLAIIANAGSPGSMLEMRATESAAKSLGLDVVVFALQRPEDISLVFDTITGPADALYVVADPLVNSDPYPHHCLGARCTSAGDLRQQGIC